MANLLNRHDGISWNSRRRGSGRPIILDGAVFFFVENILGTRFNGEETEYRVKWRGWCSWYNTWEALSQFPAGNDHEKIKEYNRRPHWKKRQYAPKVSANERHARRVESTIVPFSSPPPAAARRSPTPSAVAVRRSATATAAAVRRPGTPRPSIEVLRPLPLQVDLLLPPAPLLAARNIPLISRPVTPPPAAVPQERPPPQVEVRGAVVPPAAVPAGRQQCFLV